MTTMQAASSLMEHDLDWPSEADFILSTLDTTPSSDTQSYMRSSVPYHTAATLEVFGETCSLPPVTVYTRNVSTRAVQVISREPLPRRHDAVIRFTSPLGATKEIDCVVVQCRPAALGWFEATICFHSPEMDLAADAIAAFP